MMSTKSSDNYFYRYIINNADDISDITFNRRQIKKLQNYKKDFFYEISRDYKIPSEVFGFLKAKICNNDLILAPLEFIELLNEFPLTKLIYQITEIHDLQKLATLDNSSPSAYLFCPKTKEQLKEFYAYSEKNLPPDKVFWRFYPYDPELINSITVSDIANFKAKLKPFPFLEIENSIAPRHFEFVPTKDSGYYEKFKNNVSNKKPIVSVIIPTFNNKKFLLNVIYHLLNQNISAEDFEIIIADDGSTDSTEQIIFEFLRDTANKINITYLYWPKFGLRGNQNFFRAGLVRNVAVYESTGTYLVFLDSDMLVPKNFIQVCIDNLKKYDVIQFQRFHINQELSHLSPSYEKIDIKKDTYIEEERYWSQLFFTDDWQKMPQYWKYTCTYALGISKENFIKTGMFKKYYISYGFEDTDLGYECHLRNYKFSIVKTPLMHLTSYDKQQYKNSAKKRLQLLRVTAELFYLQHLNNEIYHLLIDFYRFQRPIKSILRDLIN